METAFFVFYVYHLRYSNNRHSQDDTHDSTERCSSNHGDKNKKRWEVKVFTHDIRHKEVIFYTLDDEIEDSDDERDFPWNPESDDNCRYECNKGSNIGYELHDATYESESKKSLCGKIKYPLYQKKSYIGDEKNTSR